MRNILVDYARMRERKKRGAGVGRISFTEGLGLSVNRDADVLAVDAALVRLAEIDTRQAEIVAMRFFGGLSIEEVAAVLRMSRRSVEAELDPDPGLAATRTHRGLMSWLRRAMYVSKRYS